MKSLKRIGMMIMVLAIILTSALPVLAATEVPTGGGGSHEIYIHKYVNGDGTWTGVENDGTDKTSELPSGVTPVAGIEFTISSAALKGGATVGSDDPDDYDLTEIINGVTASDGGLRFTGLADGIYYVEESESAASTDTSAFLINLPMTNPLGTGTLSTVHVYPKNSMTSGNIIKTVANTTDSGTQDSEAPADVGDTLTYVITATIPGAFTNYASAPGDSYTITDTLHEALTYGSATVKIGGADAVGADYTLTAPTTGNGNTLTIVFTAAGLGKLKTALAGMDGTIEVTLTTTLNEKAYAGMVSAGSGFTITNSAKSEWEVGSKEGTDEPSDPPVVAVTGLAIYKEDEREVALPGAGFTVTNDDDSEADDYAETDEKLTNTDGYAYWSSDDLEDAFTTSLGTFYALESTAPANYVKIQGYQPFAELTSTNLSASLKLTNYPTGFELPVTGGVGTLLFTLGGLMLIGAAGVVFSGYKRKKTKEKVAK